MTQGTKDIDFKRDQIHNVLSLSNDIISDLVDLVIKLSPVPDDEQQRVLAECYKLLLVIPSLISYTDPKGTKYNRYEDYIDEELLESDISKCPTCKGPADNGFDRCYPPSPYNCTKCSK